MDKKTDISRTILFSPRLRASCKSSIMTDTMKRVDLQLLLVHLGLDLGLVVLGLLLVGIGVGLDFGGLVLMELGLDLEVLLLLGRLLMALFLMTGAGISCSCSRKLGEIQQWKL